MVAGIKEKAGVHEDAKSTAEWTVGQSAKQSWTARKSSMKKRKKRKSGKRKTRWECNGMRMRSWEETLERRRMEGSSLQAEVMHKLSAWCMTRMSQGEKVRGTKEKKKVKGWSTQEMKEKANSSLEQDTEDMIKWRGMSQEEMEQCWKKLAERMEEEVLDKYKVEDSKREADRGRGAPLEWRRVRRSQKYKMRKRREDYWARIFALFRLCNLQRLLCKQEVSTEVEGMNQQQSMKIMKDLMKKIISKGRLDAEKPMVGY